MRMTCSVLLISGLLLSNPVSAQAETKDANNAAIAWPVAAQNVVWDSPSTGAKGSMPVGNGDIGLNVWVEESGDLVFLIGKTDSFDEFSRLLKSAASACAPLRLCSSPG